MININRMKLGDEIALSPMQKVKGVDLDKGKVVYIHPKKRFFTLEYTTKSGKKIQESFIPYGQIGNKKERKIS